MADTIQDVRWALAQHCELRRTDDWENPTKTLIRFDMARHCCREAARGRIVDGLCITSWFYSREGEGPSEALSLEDSLGPFGGFDAVKSVCCDCPASFGCDGRSEPLACHGRLYAPPDHSELDRLLRRVLKRTRLRARFRELFPQTSRVWYAMWMKSPLTVAQGELLSEVLPQLAGAPRPRELHSDWFQRDLTSFLLALRASAEHRIPLHVELGSPGHADLGYATTFAHCPRCKAQWGDHVFKKVRRTTARCKVCGHRFDPSATFEEVEDDFERPEVIDLQAHLGEHYDEFAKECIAKGLRPPG